MDRDWFILSEQKIKRLYIYFIIVLFAGFTLSIISLLFESIKWPFEVTITLTSIFGSIGTALVGSSIFYLRKLYKTCLNKDLTSPENSIEKTKEFGIYAYYFLRPFFAIGFSILIHIVLKSSVHIITVKETRLDEGYIYLTMLLSFFAGFSSGDLITYFEAKSADWIKKTFNHQ